MKTKKFLMTALMVMCAMTTAVFTACSSDDDDKTEEPQNEEPGTGVMECTLQTSDESLEAFDFFIKYYDSDGQVQSEKVVWNDKLEEGLRVCYKKVVAKLPATLGILFEAKAKDGLDPEGQYYFTRGYNLIFSSFSASGKQIDYNWNAPFFQSIRNKKGEFDSIKEPGRILNIIYQYDSKGKRVGTSSWD